MANTGGMATALAILGIGEQGGDAAGAQVELFDEPDTALPTPEAPRPARTGKAGRPAGARNRSTDEWLAYLASRYRSPLVGLAEMWSRTPRQLAEQLGLHLYTAAGEPYALDLETAARLQQAAMVASLPYWHKRQPMAIELEQRPRGVVVIGELTGLEQAADDLTIVTPQTVEYQRVSSPDPAQSDAQQSDAEKS